MTGCNARIAIIEDNNDLREEMIFFLQAKGYTVWGEPDAEAFWRHLHRTPADIVLVDIGLPGEDGFGVVRFLRELKYYGVIVISARGSGEDRLRGLSLGADHYLIKPVNFADLSQTISTLWQRMQLAEKSAGPSTRDTDASAHWRLGKRSLFSPEDRAITLTPQERQVLEILMRHNGQVVSKQQLHDFVFSHAHEADTHRIDVILSRLRAKARQKDMKLPLRSIFGKGIVFVGNS